MTSTVPSSPGPCMDTSIFSTRGYRALCLACSREKTALRWPRTLAVGGRTATAADAKPGGGERWIQRRGMQEEQQRIMGLYCLCHIQTAFFYCFLLLYQFCQRPEEHNTACDNSCIISYMALEEICEVWEINPCDVIVRIRIIWLRDCFLCFKLGLWSLWEACI